MTVQSYDENPSNSKRSVAKTSDGGLHWTEMLVDQDHSLQEFGIAFIDVKHGWLGGRAHGYEMLDGGIYWRPTEFGAAVNKIRIVRAKPEPIFTLSVVPSTKRLFRNTRAST